MAKVIGLSNVTSPEVVGGVPIDMVKIYSFWAPSVFPPLLTTSNHKSSITVALFPCTLSLGIGVWTLVVTKFAIIAPGTVTLPDMKFGNTSFVRLLVVLLRLAIAVVDLFNGALRRFGTVEDLRRRLVVFFLKRFFEPLGKNLPLASLGKVLASFLPLATRLRDFLRLRLGISSLKKRGDTDYG